jgi:hypothetical protein
MKKCLVHFASKRNKAKKRFFVSLKNRKRNEAKRKIVGSKTKRKYGVLISLLVEAKNSKRKEAKKLIFSRERAKRMRNGSRFASFRFETKTFLKRNRHTLIMISLLG